jgi:hypothetical protein
VRRPARAGDRDVVIAGTVTFKIGDDVFEDG